MCITPGLNGPSGINVSTALFGNADELLFHRFNVDVGEVDIEEYHTADFLELLLHSSPSFLGRTQVTDEQRPCRTFIWIEQLE